MLDFKKIKEPLTKHFTTMVMENDILFVVNVNKDELYNKYLEAIPPEHNRIYKVRREYDCSCCRHFIKSIGGVVAIKNGVVESIWDFEADDQVWTNVARTLSDFVKQFPVVGVYISKENHVGTDYNMDMDENGEPVRWNHFYLSLPDKYVFNDRYSTIGTKLGDYESNKNVFKRSLDELTIDATETVLDLIKQNSLYKGEENKKTLATFLKCQKKYAELTDDTARNLYAWENSVRISPAVCKIRNTSIGTLLIDVSEGMDLDQAVNKYEKVVAPENYKRSKPIFTQKMLDDAQKKIEELGYMDSLKRRYATLDDININNILFSNKDVSRKINDGNDLFADLSKETKKSAKRFSKVEEIPIQKFIDDVLPTATSVEAYVENRHTKNLVSLIAPEVADSKSMFKWNNNFSWAYTGNITDSILKQNVEKAGGKVDGVLRFSIMWNDGNEWNKNDEDAHCITPDGNEIYYAHKKDPKTLGNLDVDIIDPDKGIPAVENITWPSIDKMTPGVYKFFVQTYSYRGGKDGFRAEIECNGEIHSYDYPATKSRNKADVAEVILSKDKTFTIKDILPSDVSNKETWGVHTNEFVPVSVICYSPNYWDEQNGIGNKHFFFMLKDCKNDEEPNSFYNEFLNNDLYPAHKKIMEALGSKAHVDECDNQLSGLGFSSTQRNDLVVKVKGNVERILRIKF